MTHMHFVLASYGVTGLVFMIVLLWLLIDGRSTKQALARLEEAGIQRRSSNKNDGV